MALGQGARQAGRDINEVNNFFLPAAAPDDAANFVLVVLDSCRYDSFVKARPTFASAENALAPGNHAAVPSSPSPSAAAPACASSRSRCASARSRA